jgi:hypothetical protein
MEENEGMPAHKLVENDPMPTPPEAPDLDACCNSGCSPCVFDLHDLAMDDYRQALRAWRLRQAPAPPPNND